MVSVTKFDGTKQIFDRNKVVNTCMRMRATREQAEKVASNIEKQIYDGIQTKKILQMVFAYLQEFRPEIKHRVDLREAISRLRPKPDFEVFVALLLREYGYSVVGSQLIAGSCVTHEIDGVAIRDSEVIMVEVKHHFQHHTYTGVDIFLETQATLEDLRDGFTENKHKLNFSRALIVCNTKFSDHALQYARCKGIEFIGWKAPPEFGLEKMIEEKKFYPITLIRNLDSKIEEKLGDNGVLTLKQLLQYDIALLQRKTKIPIEKLKFLMRTAREISS
jgi:Holliday junction resolvase-like predicted endonuclease